MEVVLFALLVAVLIVVFGLRNRISGLESEVRSTRLQMQELMKQWMGTYQAPEAGRAVGSEPTRAGAQAAPTAVPESEVTQVPPVPPTVPRAEDPIFPPAVLEPATPASLPAPAAPANISGIPQESAPTEAAQQRMPPPPKRPTFMERNPDLEKFIGENLINKIGIAILVLGLGLLLKYAIGRGYIGETAQTLIGIASGGVLIFLGHRLREKFRAFSSVLVGGGLAVLYFSIAIAYQEYRVLGQTAAFAIMVGITTVGVLLTLAYDRRELAVIALLGGFATPFLVSSGEGNFKVLFTYLLILNAGMLVLANYKKWSIINILSFALSWLLFGSWAILSYGGIDPAPVRWAMAFATAFYAVFFAMLLWYDLRHRTPFTALDYSLFVANTALYFGFSMQFLNDLDVRVGGLLCVLLAAVNVVFALRFFRDQRVPRNLVYLLIGVVLTFISLAAPVQLDGDHITLFWAAEAVLLLWFAKRAGIRLVERTSLLVTLLMVVSLVMDLDGYLQYREVALAPVINRLFITGLVVILSLVLQARLWRSWEPAHEVLNDVRARLLVGTYTGLAVVLGFTMGLLELEYQLALVLPYGSVYMAGTAFGLLYLIAVDLGTQRAGKWLRIMIGVLYGFAFTLFITAHYGTGMQQLKDMRMGLGDGSGHMTTHYLAFGLVVVAIIRTMRWSREVLALRSPHWNMYAWVMCTLLVVVASQELDHVLLAVQPAQSVPGELYQALYKARTAGYPILWGIGSFLFMTYGMRARLRMVRIIALTLFGITLLKLFLYDIEAASEGARVAAFISLGVLLLVMSFLYQKLKVLLKDDADAPIP